MFGIGLGLSLTTILSSSFFPASLFLTGEPGVWYDPSDLTTLFQDTAGTTPVTTPGQTVALALDKSKGLVLGSELWADQTPTVTNFTGSAGAYNDATNTMSNGSAGGSSGWPRFSFNLGLTVGKRYKVEIALSGDVAKVTNINAGGGTAFIGGTGATRSGIIEATGASLVIQTSPDTGWAVALASVSVRELPGFHATQATAASRPTYGIVPSGGRRNLATNTDNLGGSTWSNVQGVSTVAPNAFTGTTGRVYEKIVPAATTAIHGRRQNTSSFVAGSVYTLSQWVRRSEAGVNLEFFAFTGVGHSAVFNLTTGSVSDTLLSTATISGPDADGAYLCTMTFTANSTITNNTDVRLTRATVRDQTFVGDGTTGILVAQHQRELGSTATAYQRVGSAFDVTEAGVQSLSYLSFDGVDDFLVTPTITPNIDKAQVFAGVRKLSDAARGIIAEFGPDGSVGRFILQGPHANTASTYALSSLGTSFIITTASGFPAPITNVLTGLGDIAGDLATLRINGTQVAQSTADQGTGNYLAYPLYIGRRGGTSLPFNGNLYSLIVRFGANLDANTITNTETWVNSKTGAF